MEKKEVMIMFEQLQTASAMFYMFGYIFLIAIVVSLIVTAFYSMSD